MSHRQIPVHGSLILPLTSITHTFLTGQYGNTCKHIVLYTRLISFIAIKFNSWHSCYAYNIENLEVGIFPNNITACDYIVFRIIELQMIISIIQSQLSKCVRDITAV